ncbi:MAG TPA: cation:proton antiporter [Egibacteraceae bacterium]
MTELLLPPLLAADAAAQEAAFGSLLGQASALLLAAALIGYVSIRLRVVPIAGFLVAGVLIGPHGLGVVSDEQVVEMVAEIGIVLLLFTIGIEFSLERLLRIRRYVFLGGGAKVALAVAATVAVLLPLGVSLRDAVFTGFLVSISSTAIVLKVLSDRGEVTSRHGQLALALLIFEDLAAVLMVLLVPVLAGDGSPLEIVRVLATAAALIAVVLVVARRVMPPVLEVIARACSPEVFLLSIVALCFGFAYLTNLAGVSVSLGAFLAGLLVSESRQSDHALGEILPLQILFSAAFFLSIGMLLDVRFLLSEPLLVLAAAVIGLGIPLLTTTAAARLAGVGAATAITAAFLLAQVSEFAFVIQRAGAEEGLSPAGLGEGGVQAFIAATVLLMLATPGMAALGRRLAAGVPRRRAAPPPESPPAAADSAEQAVLVSGWGPGARHVCHEVRAAGRPVRVITLNPDGAGEAEAAGFEVHVGDSTKQHVLLAAGIRDAAMLVIADDEPEQARRIASVASELAPDLPITVRSPGEADLDEFVAAGVTHLVSAERASLVKLSAAVLGDLTGRGHPHAAVDMTRIVTVAVDPQTACPHVATVRPVIPSSFGCEDCLRSGDDWVHLRICLVCGHVGCCDSSPNRHARRHAEDSQHLVVKSAEPGEDWVYCFADDLLMATAEPASQPA